MTPYPHASTFGDLLVLAQENCCQGGHDGAQAACDGPPGVLDKEADDDEDAAEWVVHKHHLRCAPEHPVKKLEHRGLVCNGTGQKVSNCSGVGWPWARPGDRRRV